MANFGEILNNIAIGASQSIRRNSGDTAFEAFTPASSSSPLTTKGDIYTYSTGDARLAVGTNGQVLSADSAEATGLKWIAAGGGGVPYTGATADVDIGTYKFIGSALQANGSGGGALKTNGGSNCALFGAGGSANGTLYGGWNYDGGTANTLVSLGASKTFTSLDTATYPSLTEVSYVKGVTSAIQTQLNAKLSSAAIDVLMFGDGGDPDTTISAGTTTLTRNMYYNNLTISGTGSINPNGWLVFVKGTLNLDNAPANAIAASGLTGIAGTTASTSTTNGLPSLYSVFSNFLGSPSSGRNGGGGNTLTGTGVAGSTLAASYVFSGQCAAGGAGGNSATGSGGAGGVASTTTTTLTRRNFSLENATVGTSAPTIGASGSGGGGGAGDATAGASGASGGGGGGGIWLFANTISRSSSTTTAGAISAKGGTGGAGGASVGGIRGGGGGGSGGSGGVVYIIYKTLTGTAKTGLVDASGGAGGTGGAGFGVGGIGGGGGGSGGTGLVLLCDFTAYTISSSGQGNGSAGSAASGNTGGSGAAANTLTVTL